MNDLRIKLVLGNPKRFLIFLWFGLFLSACATASPSGLGATSTVSVPTLSPPIISTQTPTQQPIPSTTPEGSWINLEPNNGKPGSSIIINGYLPGGLPEADLESQNYTTYAAICWGGCQTGLEEDGLEVTWSRVEPGHFSIKFIVPPIPWLSSDGFHSLEKGDYPVDLINLDPSKNSCNSEGGCPRLPVASATFHLTQSAPYPPCQEKNCGSLVASPAEAAPGDRVFVKGWAPLVQFVGSPFGYNLVLETQGNTSSQNIMYLAVEQNEAVQQAMDGSLTASFQVPQYGNDGSPLAPGSYTLALMAPLTHEKNAFPILVGPTTFKIEAAPAWSDLPHTAPLRVQHAANLFSTSMEQDPLDPSRLVYCTSGGIRISQNAGQSWTTIPVMAPSLPSPSDRLAMGEEQPTCVSVILDSSHPDSMYAIFALVEKEYGAPPLYFMGYFTTDLGRTWQLVPIPAIDASQNVIYDNFGGFWTDGMTVQVLYDGKAGDMSQPPTLQVKQTVDGGKSWSDATLSCPSPGPCIRWGAAPAMVSGMGADLTQSVLASPDGGKSWLDTGQSVALRMSGPHELVALSSTDIILISGTHRFPLRYSRDGGMTWQVFSLPAIPGSQVGYFTGYPGLQMLPDGSLIAMRSDTGAWMRLSPNTNEWCLTSLTSSDLLPVAFSFTGNRVWWFSGVTMESQSAPQSELSCQK